MYCYVLLVCCDSCFIYLSQLSIIFSLFYFYLSIFLYFFLFFFFFQAEDGIRDLYVTGVQTCALPIWPRPGLHRNAPWPSNSWRTRTYCSDRRVRRRWPLDTFARRPRSPNSGREIGRASCRERV